MGKGNNGGRQGEREKKTSNPREKKKKLQHAKLNFDEFRQNGKEEKAIQRNGIFSAVLFIHSNRTGGGSKQRK